MGSDLTRTDPVDELAAELASADSLVGPIDLFDRWEKQTWTTRELLMEQDRAGWQSLGDVALHELRLLLYQFFLGEAVVTTTLPALTLAAPTHSAQCYLATQVADEARHTVFFARYLDAVGEAGAADVDALAERWLVSSSASHSQFFKSELVRATEAVRIDPTNKAAWMEGITIYHLLAEAVIGISGQRAIIRTAHRSKRLPVLAQGALNVARDESRHIAFGVRSLREGVHEGHGDVISSMVCKQIPLLTEILVSPEQKLPCLVYRALPHLVDEISARWDAAYEALVKRLRLVGLGDLLGDVDRLWRDGVRHALKDYEVRHGVAHPVIMLGTGHAAAMQASAAAAVSMPTVGRNV